jgi:hypothetical protein
MTWLLSLAMVGALTTPGAQMSADDRELSTYRLTADVLTKAEAVARNFDANLSKDPRMKRRLDAQREIAALEKKGNLSDADEDRMAELQEIVGDEPIIDVNGGSLSEMAAQYQKVPAMAAALKSAGMTPRDFAKFVVTAVQAAMVTGLGMPVPPSMGENVKFVTANQATMDRINRLLGAR